MVNENTLDNIISEDEAGMDKLISDIFRFSAEMKKHLKLVKDPSGLELYYLSISRNNEKYLEKIKDMDLNAVSALYAALKHPVMFVDLDKKKIEYLSEGFEGVEVTYDIKEARIDKKEAKRLSNLLFYYDYYPLLIGAKKETKRLSNLHSKIEWANSKEDLKYAKMYDISYRIKDKGIKVILTQEGNTLESYLTELSALGKDGKRIIDYLSSLKNEDAKHFINISNFFSIIDTNNNILYAMESFKDMKGDEIVKMSTHDRKEGGYEFMYDLIDRAKKNPNEKVFFVNPDEDENYHPNSKPPSDMYS